MEQKLVTVYLTELHDPDRGVQEHLSEYLADGWRIYSVHPLPGSGGGDSQYTKAWFIVLLDRGTAPADPLA